MTQNSTENFFDGIDNWVFDLDNTLYPVTKRLLAHIDQHMSGFVARFLDVDRVEARKIQKEYFHKYGLTLRGLMIHHDLDPAQYFEEMTPMDLDEVEPNPDLGALIARLPGRKFIYTNSSHRHSGLVLDRLEISGVFDGIFDIADADFIPKPAVDPYRTLCKKFDIVADRAVMIDDIARNLAPAAEIGMKTVWMRTGAEWAKDVEVESHIHHVTHDIDGWVRDALAATGADAADA